MYDRVDGNVALLFALSFPVVVMLATYGVEYAKLVRDQTLLQSSADAAALGAAKQLNLANSTNSSSASAAAISVANAEIRNTDPRIIDDIVANVVDGGNGVDVTITRTEPSLFGSLLGTGSFNVKAHARAHSIGGAPICAIALDRKVQGAVTLDASAVVDAHNCAVYSDSNSKQSILADQSSVLKTILTCAVGVGKGYYTNFSPQPKTGCPPVSDPLISRAPPSFGGCDYTGLVISATSTGLRPGVYCGGLKVTAQARVNLESGNYIMEGGPLVVDGGASLTGVNVGFYLTKFVPGSPPIPKPGPGPGPATAGPAPGTTLYFAQDSTISLTAPKTGALAGLLFFEDRQMPKNQLHQILSNNAQTLIGTIYLPQGRLFVGSNAPVAANSAYTVIVADTVELSAGPTLVLNADYGATDVPVPAGVGPSAASVSLTQ